ncbi:MAG: hypothetical protein LUH10_06135 [Tannerellaceae bacterium]|nr:hypothetical protein [Tannerellaceae bacterium]
MENTPVTTFKLSKKKKTGLYLTAVSCGIAGPLLLWQSHFLMFGSGRLFILLTGIVLSVIAIFAVLGLRFLAKEKDAAIYISDEGIMDISTGNSIGTVLWKDVENIKVMDDISNLKQKYLVLRLRNPKKYIDRERNGSKRRSLELRLQYYNSPICISTRALDCSFEELQKAVEERYKAWKENNQACSDPGSH